QAAGGGWCETPSMHSIALLRRGSAMPRRHRTRAYPTEWPDINCQTRSQVAPCESTAGIAWVSLPDGLASETQQRPPSCVALRGDAINSCRSQAVNGLVEDRGLTWFKSAFVIPAGDR